MTGSLGGDISYTLEHFPNHHRALASMAKLGLRLKSAQPHGARYTVSCYFERAIAFAPHDVTARMVYGSYLLATGQDAMALEQLDAASRLAPEQATIQYNLGLMYVKKKEYEKASAHAQKSLCAGFSPAGAEEQAEGGGQVERTAAHAGTGSGRYARRRTGATGRKRPLAKNDGLEAA